MSELSTQWAELRTPQFARPAFTAATGEAREAIAILPIGSTEQHGPHLPVMVDSLLAAEVAQRTAALMRPDTVHVLPTLWVSLAEHHMGFAGSLSLDYDTLLAFLRCIVRSLARQGYRRVLLLNGHGGNMAALVTMVDALSVEDKGVSIATATYWVVAAPAFAQILEGQANLLHACEAETSMLMVLRPDLVDTAAARSVDAPATGFLQAAGSHRWRNIAHWSCSGVVGVPRLASTEKGELLLGAAAEAMRSLLREPAFW